jgi:hypothetical protein
LKVVSLGGGTGTDGNLNGHLVAPEWASLVTDLYLCSLDFQEELLPTNMSQKFFSRKPYSRAKVPRKGFKVTSIRMKVLKERIS